VKPGSLGIILSQNVTSTLKNKSLQQKASNVLLRVRRRLYKTGIGLTTGFIRSQSITQLGYSVLHFTTHNNCVSSLPLKIPAPTAATNSYGSPCHHSLSDNYLLKLSRN
jgi:hypothetical protein